MAQKKESQERGGQGSRSQERQLARTGGSGELAPWGGMHPFRRMLAEMDWMFDQMQRGVFGGLLGGGGFGGEQAMGRLPRMDVEETDEALVLRIEIPGVDPKDLRIEESDGVLTIRGETRREEGDERRRSESRATYVRQIALPGDLEPDTIQASYRDGLLTLRLPRATEGRHAKRIPINVEGREERAA
jgi:HSP20 family protein